MAISPTQSYFTGPINDYELIALSSIAEGQDLKNAIEEVQVEKKYSKYLEECKTPPYPSDQEAFFRGVSRLELLKRRIYELTGICSTTQTISALANRYIQLGYRRLGVSFNCELLNRYNACLKKGLTNPIRGYCIPDLPPPPPRDFWGQNNPSKTQITPSKAEATKSKSKPVAKRPSKARSKLAPSPLRQSYSMQQDTPEALSLRPQNRDSRAVSTVSTQAPEPLNPKISIPEPMNYEQNLDLELLSLMALDQFEVPAAAAGNPTASQTFDPEKELNQ